jgi:putative hydrolase of the HAD superfamily
MRTGAARPSLVVFDAAGTLVEVEGSVGEAYAAVAREHGARLEPRAIERGFARAMAVAPPLAFGDRPAPERPAAARSWWRSVAGAALEAAGDLPAGFAFESFFDRAWERFAEPSAWRVSEDVRPALRALRRAGLPLAVFSNWDGRLGPLLAGLGLSGWFCRVLVSSELTAAKPAPAAFAAVAAELASVGTATRPLMIGDRLDHDVLPAIAAGWGAVWLDRHERGGAPPGVDVVRDLRGLSGLLG